MDEGVEQAYERDEQARLQGREEELQGLADALDRDAREASDAEAQ